MAVFTDNPPFAARLLDLDAPARDWAARAPGDPANAYVDAFLQPAWRLTRPIDGPFPDMVIAETADRSNYDRLIELVRGATPLPDRLACLAGSGHGFHGFKGRSWSAVPGNIHLSVHLAPRRPVPRFEVAFMALAAVSVVEAIDRLPGLAGRAGIRWVNDVLVDGAKVAGVLAYTHAQRTTVNAAVLGIGVNVDTRPPVQPTPFVPSVAALAEHAGPAAGEAPAAPLPAVFLAHLLEAIDRNYRTLMDRGHGPLVERYRARSVVLGRRIEVCAEDSDTEKRVLERGVVRAIGDGLELFLEGQEAPVTRGRIVVVDEDGSSPH